MTPIVVDIETAPLMDAEQYLDPPSALEPPDLAAITPAKNLVDPAKILADIEKRQKIALADYAVAQFEQAAKWEKTIADCSKDPDLGRIVAVGWMMRDDEKPRVITCRNETDEKFALEQLGRDYFGIQPRFVTFNGLDFDLPFLMRRALYLRVKFPVLNLDRYRSPHIDLMQHLSHNGKLRYRGLQWYLNRFGIPNEDSSTGAQIGAMVKAGDWAGVSAHCASDVLCTRALAQRLGLVDFSKQERADEAIERAGKAIEGYRGRAF
jgi:predicted PolB exonuclease-like 3'-5' exonuclease